MEHKGFVRAHEMRHVDVKGVQRLNAAQSTIRREMQMRLSAPSARGLCGPSTRTLH